MLKRYPPIVVLCILLVPGCDLLRCGVDIRDFSNFDLFRYQYQPAFESPQLGFIWNAQIEKIETNEYECDISIVGYWDESMDPQASIPSHDTSYTAIELGRRTLTVNERNRMKNLFKDVEILKNADRECERVSIDPFRIHSFRWDDFSISDYVCSAPRLAADQRDALLRFLDSLRGEDIREW